MIASVSPAKLPEHFLFLIISLVFFLFFSFLDLEILLPFSPIIYVACVIFLILPFFLGTVTRGSVRWIPLAGFTIQPSELVKPFLALIAANFWSRGEFTFKKLVNYLLLFMPVLALVFLQPDLGSTLVIASIFSGMLFISGISFKQALACICVGLLCAVPVWFFLQPYQKTRITHFFNPYLDPLGKGYNVIQAKIAVGSGGVLGRGLGRGTQSHLAFLPERHTDFIFASLSEELGMAGGVIVLLLYLFLFFRILKIAAGVEFRSSFLVLGLFFYLAFQTLVNIGMNIGLLPITGVTLPLISYGGSSLLTTMVSLGLVSAVSRQEGREKVIEIR